MILNSKIIKGAALLAFAAIVSAPSIAQSSADTLKKYSIDELWIVGTTKENRALKQQPISSTIVTRKNLEQGRIFSMKSLTGIVPNLYIPNYGTKLTSSIYIRGIGSRINSSAVGVYVDGLPYWDKSSFDFDYADIERIEVLRGPQGTLYGKNTMGGLINITTKSPFDYAGTDVMLGVATKGNYRASLTHYHRVSSKFAFSAGGFADRTGGFYTNAFSGKKIDKGASAGGRIHAVYKPSNHWKIDLNASYEYTDDGGYPYGEYNKESGEYSAPNYNYESSYYRNLLNSGLIVSYTPSSKYTITSSTGWQYLRDRMKMDQDYTPADRFTMIQMQKQNAITQEFMLKGHRSGIWEGMDFSTGLSGFYSWNRNQTPLTFGKDFIAALQATMDAAMIHSPVKVKLTDDYIPIPGLFHLPSSGVALYHQSVFNGLFGVKGLSATLALRIDYEKNSIKYNTGGAMNYKMERMGKVTEGKYEVAYIGNQSQRSTTLLPRFALKYDINSKNNIYAIVSRGYRSGGFNIQMLSDYMQADMQKNVGTLENDETINAALKYKPEFSWNREIGAHLTLLQSVLNLDVSLFHTKIKDQQVSRFAESGLGRYTSNAGQSRSYGMEASLIYTPIYGLTFVADYGYTNAKFVKNLTQVVVNEAGKRTIAERDYKGKYVPFAPLNTLRFAAAYSFDLGASDKLSIGADFIGLGKVYYTEANDVAQNFYSLINSRVTYSIGNSATVKRSGLYGVEVSLWCNNLFNKDYSLFYFDSGSTGFMQKGKGIHGGIEIRFKF